MINQVTLVGRVASEVSTGDAGKMQYARFRLKTWRTIQGKEGPFEKETTHMVSCFGNSAKSAASFKEGNLVSVQGCIDRRKVKGEDGKPDRWFDSVNADSVAKLETSKHEEAADDDNIPF